MNNTKQIDDFIQLLYNSMEKKANSINDDVKIRFKIKDLLWSAVFLFEHKDLSICTTKNGVTSIYPLTPEEDEPKDLITLKIFLIDQIKSKKVSFEELERFIFESI